MGYTTHFEGRIDIVPPLNEAEVKYLKAFNDTRRMNRTEGPYFVGGTGFHGQDNEGDVIDYNHSDPSQPGLWCQWIPEDDGSGLVWDEGEKFYHSDVWMAYIINHFLKPGAEASKIEDPQFAEFTFDHFCGGEILADGEDTDDFWKIVVRVNEVKTANGRITYEEG